LKRLRLLIPIAALVLVLFAVGCSGENDKFTPPAFSDAEVIGAIKGHLRAPGMDDFCRDWVAQLYLPDKVRQDPSNPDKYLATSSKDPQASWTFIGSSGRVISTSSGHLGSLGC
jgi:hypothetical protein